MKRKSYSDLLKDPRWQKVRLEKLQAADWACEVCYESEEMLSVHHKHYVKGRSPWEYAHHELVVLCQSCHECEHREIDLRKELIARLPVDGPGCVSELFAIGAGYACEQACDDGAYGVLEQFSESNPYQVQLGRFMAMFDRTMRLSFDGVVYMRRALAEGTGNSFFDELDSLLKKHGVQLHLGCGGLE